MSNVIAFPVQVVDTARSDPFYGSGRRMLDLDQLCEWLNITERHARKLVERDAIPYRKVGRLLRFFEPEVEEWTRPGPRRQAEPSAEPSPVAVTATRTRRPRTSSTSRISLSVIQ